MFISLISFLCIEILAVILPGPDFFIVLRSSLRYGKFPGIIVSLGIASGAAICVTLIVSLLDSLQEHVLFIVHWISLFGGCYLLYLAYICYRDSNNAVILQEDNINLMQLSNIRLFLIGLFCNLTNPKTIIFFISVLPIFVLKCHGFLCSSILVVMVFLISAIWFSVVSFLVGSDRVREMLVKYTSKLEIVFSLILAIFASYLIFSFISKFL